jgi:ABC-type dipeptide/oligopeptide/nickel transport system permease subunit
MARGETLVKPEQRTGQPVTLSEGLVHRSLWGDAVRRFSRNRLAMLGVVILIFLIFLAVFADMIAPYRYDLPDYSVPVRTLPFQTPRHILGTDGNGRDYLTRLIYGARTSMLVGLAIPALAYLIGVPLSGYRARR